MNKRQVEFLRKQFPEGSRVTLRQMGDDPDPLPSGSKGTLEHIDDVGTFHVKWDNGRTLGVDMEMDDFSLSPPPPTPLRLYMPLTADLFTRNYYGDMDDEPEELNGRDLAQYEDAIRGHMARYEFPEEAERGLMHYYDEPDAVNEKVRSARFTVEKRMGKLWGVADCRVVGTLTPQELDTLKEYLSGQASDGFGEGYEQQELRVGDGELYIHLWSFDDNWSIQTEQERFGPKLAEGLPELCWTTTPGTGKLVCIKRGESGYYPSDWETGDPAKNRATADFANQQRGITKAQEQAMVNGSMLGWDSPGADPKFYEQEHLRQGGMTLE